MAYGWLMPLLQKTALAALFATLLLIFVGAIVRVSGAGLGCPDWPRCWGALWPPSSLEEVDWERLDIEKFQRKRPGISKESLAAEFNPRHVWTEYLNRLTALPVGLFSFATLILAIVGRRRHPRVWRGALSAMVLVLANAVLGAIVVSSGLRPGVITLHMALAVVLVVVQVWVVSRSGVGLPQIRLPGGRRGWWIAATLFGAVVLEGVMGSQVREETDLLMRSHEGIPRAEWAGELEATLVYLVHRSFSWVVLVLGAAFFWATRGARGDLARLTRTAMVGIVIAQMVLGVTMAHVSVAPVVQVLHIGLSAIFVAAGSWFLLASRASPADGASPQRRSN